VIGVNIPEAQPRGTFEEKISGDIVGLLSIRLQQQLQEREPRQRLQERISSAFAKYGPTFQISN
jgi:hypothetical protein